MEGAKKQDIDVPAGAAGEHIPPAVAPQTPAHATKDSGAQKGTIIEDAMGSGLVRCILFDLEAIQKERVTLKAMAEFGSLLLWYYLSDRTTLLGESGKSYNRDIFSFIFLVLTCVAFGPSSLQILKSPSLLNRSQTEEWKGWMQVLFLLYHYFEAREIYNAIRVFIAAYVWMTGFGNFSYYYKTNDYCIGRFAQMMWRLNFLVFFACVVLRNSYMLYYICPMHTIYTIFVYACLGIAPQFNKNNLLLGLKMLLALAVIVICWDIKAVFYAIWTPFLWLVGYNDPRNPGGDSLHEWFFRSSLDRYIWIYGMLCAWVHPQAAAFLNFIDNLPAVNRAAMRTLVITITLAIGYAWYANVYCLPKLQYNELHPYTSWIPITIWIVLRNMLPIQRLWHLRLYGWLGCITLETYIGQFHIWLRSNIPDGQPKTLLAPIPGAYPLLNFALCTAGYVLVSHRLFNLTNTLKDAAVPHSNDRLLLRNTIMMVLTGGGLYLICWVFTALLVIIP